MSKNMEDECFLINFKNEIVDFEGLIHIFKFYLKDFQIHKRKFWRILPGHYHSNKNVSPRAVRALKESFRDFFKLSESLTCISVNFSEEL